MNDKRFTDSQQILLETLCRVSESELLKALDIFLRKHYQKIEKTDNYIIAYGDIPVGLIAHIDTVFPTPPDEIYFDEKYGVMWSPQGLGADDRAGIFAIIEIIGMGWRPTIIFTTGEEIGGVGAQNLVFDKPKVPCKLMYLIELDRAGFDDCVFYNCNNIDFTKYVESFKFKEAYGTYSDITFIAPVWEIAAVNLSIGYVEEHNYVERVFIDAIYETIDKVIKMLKDSLYLKEPFKYISKSKEEEYICEEIGTCAGCGQTDSLWSLIPVDDKYYCLDCVPKYVNWCKNCNEAYSIIPGVEDRGVCPKCLEKIGLGGKDGSERNRRKKRNHRKA